MVIITAVRQLATRGPRVLAVLPAGEVTRTDYQADPNTNIYTKHGPYINKLTLYTCRLQYFDLSSDLFYKIELKLWVTRFFTAYQIFYGLPDSSSW